MPGVDTKRYFAVGFKDWIELRVAKEPPKAERSKIERPGFEGIYYKTVPATNWYGYKVEEYNRKLKGPILSVVYWHGGRVVASLKRKKFIKVTNLTVQNQCMKEIPSTLAAEVIKMYRSKRRGRYAE